MNVNNFELIEIMSSYDINDYIENCEKYKCILRFFSGSCYLLKINNNTVEMKEICKIIENEIVKNIDYYVKIYENESKLKNSDLRNYQENHIDEFDILVNYDLRCIDELNNSSTTIHKEYNTQNMDFESIMLCNELAKFKNNLIEKRYILEDVSKIPEKYKSFNFSFSKNKIFETKNGVKFYMNIYELLRIMLKNNILKKLTLKVDTIFYIIFLNDIRNIYVNSKFDIFEGLRENTSLIELKLIFDFTESNLVNQSVHFFINELKNNKSITSISFGGLFPTNEITISIFDLLEVNNSINKISMPFSIYSEEVYNRLISIIESNKLSLIHFNNHIFAPLLEYYSIFNNYIYEINKNNVKLHCSIYQLNAKLL